MSEQVKEVLIDKLKLGGELLDNTYSNISKLNTLISEHDTIVSTIGDLVSSFMCVATTAIDAPISISFTRDTILHEYVNTLPDNKTVAALGNTMVFNDGVTLEKTPDNKYSITPKSKSGVVYPPFIATYKQVEGVIYEGENEEVLSVEQILYSLTSIQ